MSLIQPRTLRGFRDHLPEVMIPREQMMQTARSVFRSFGFAPIDTPTLEYLEILLGKGSEETDRQIYRFQDAGGRNVGMRFDLTIPLARFAAQHVNTLGTPFKRYHIAPVWRGENTQAGRYREFVQCDFDTIGTESVLADIETVTVINSLLEAIGFERFTISINNRVILSGLLDHLGLSDRAVPILRSLDKLAKIGREKTCQEMCAVAEIDSTQADAVMSLAECDGDAESVFAQLPEKTGRHEGAAAGIDRLREVYQGAIASAVPASRLRIDLSIARGLDYYTGVVVETTLDDLPEIGSICSGGRYDNLAELYTKQHLPGIGASLGLDRLIAAMEQLKLLPSASTPAPVLVTYFDESHRDDYLRLAANLRAAGIGTEVYPDAKKLGAQLKYADRKGFRLAIIVGEDEWSESKCQLKTLATKETTDVPYSHDDAQALIQRVKELLTAGS